MRDILLAGVVTVVTATWVAGCGSCRTKTEEGPPPATPVSSAPASDVVSGGPPLPEPSQVAAAEPLVQPPDWRKTRLVETIHTMPASFWNLELRKHVVLRGKTKRALAPPKNVQNPLLFPPVTLAVLDLEKDGVPGDFFEGYVQKLYELLFEQKVFTAAAPVMAFWEPFRRTREPRWSVAVPVGEDASVTSPLRLHRMPAIRAHLERISPKDASKYLPPESEKKSLFELSRAVIEAMRKQTALTVNPTYVMVRLPDIHQIPIGPESVFEILFVGEGPPPDPAAPASP